MVQCASAGRVLLLEQSKHACVPSSTEFDLILQAASTSPQHVPGPMQCQWWILALSTLATACIALLPMVVGYYRTLLAAQRAEIATLRGDLLCANTAFEGVSFIYNASTSCYCGVSVPLRLAAADFSNAI